MNEGVPKNEENNKKKGSIICHPDASEEEVLNLISRPVGFDDGQPKIVYNTEGLLEGIEKDGKMLLFEIEAEEAPGGNQLKFLEGVRKKIISLEKNKIELEKSLEQDVNKTKKIKTTLEIQRLEGIIVYLENIIKEIPQNN